LQSLELLDIQPDGAEEFSEFHDPLKVSRRDLKLPPMAGVHRDMQVHRVIVQQTQCAPLVDAEPVG